MNLPAMAQHVVEALVNGALQGVVILVLVAMAIRWIPGMNAATRHAVWFASLLLIAALPAVHGLRDLAPAGSRPALEASGDRALPEPSIPKEIATEVPQAPASHSADASGIQIPGEAPGIAWIEPPSIQYPAFPRGWFPMELPEPDVESHIETETPLASEPAEEPVIVPTRWTNWTIPLSEKVSLALVIAWWIPAIFRLARLVSEVFCVGRLKRGAGAAPASISELFRRIRMDMGVSRPVSLRLGAADAVPFVAGFLHPVVVLPEGYAEAHPEADVAQVLRHELAHVRRRDDWTHLIEQGLRAVLWFHPGVHWVVRRLSLEREIACDDHVLRAAHGAKNYALLLTGFARCRPGRDLLAAPAVWSRKTQLKERITMILDSKRNSSPRIARAMAGLLMLGTAGVTGLMLQAGPQLAVVPPPSAGGDAEATPIVAGVSAPVVLAVAVEKDVTEPKIKVAISGEPPDWPPQPPKPAATPLPPTPHEPFAVPNVNVQIDPVADVDFTTPGKDKGKSRSVVSEGKGRGSLEERLERLERMVEKLIQSPDTIKFHLGPDSATIARVVEAAKKASKDAKANLPDPEKLARIHKEAEAAARNAAREGERAAREAAREGERAAREAERAARDAVRATQQAIREQQQERSQSVERGKEFRVRLEQQRKELEAQHRNLEREMESLERRMERLERDTELLEQMEESREEEARKSERKTKSTAKAAAAADPAPAGKAETYSKAKP